MDIPQIPSDNLYKYEAIAGLVLVVVSMALLTSSSFLVYEQAREIRAEIRELVSGRQEIERERLDAERNGLLGADAEGLDRRRVFDERIALVNSQINEARQGVIPKQVLYIFVFFWGGLGGLAMGHGFSSWYFHGQRFEDEKLKLEVAKLREEVETMKGARNPLDKDEMRVEVEKRMKKMDARKP